MALRRLAISILLALPLLLTACDVSRVPFLWKTYEHPTYRFSVRVPRSWDIRRDGLRGADVVFLAGKTGSLFRANANIVVRKRNEKITLETAVNQSVRQLQVLLSEYEVLSRAPKKLGNLRAIELRARYRAAEGYRILRTIIGESDDMQYVATFSSREEEEKRYQKSFERIRRSFHAERNLSNG